MRFFLHGFFKKKHKRNKIIVAYAVFLHAFVRKKRIRNCIVELRMCVTYAPSYSLGQTHRIISQVTLNAAMSKDIYTFYCYPRVPKFHSIVPNGQ